MNPTDPLDDEALARTLTASCRLEDAPPALIARVIATWPAAASPGGLRGAVGRVLAALVADTGAAAAPALGLRSARSGVRQLLFSAAGRDIDLRVAAAPEGPDGWVLSGQVLGPDVQGEVSLAGPAGQAQRVALSELAEFCFAPVPAGTWSLSLHAGTLEIALPPIEVGPG